jgi:hypothetical protein
MAIGPPQSILRDPPTLTRCPGSPDQATRRCLTHKLQPRPLSVDHLFKYRQGRKAWVCEELSQYSIGFTCAIESMANYWISDWIGLVFAIARMKVSSSFGQKDQVAFSRPNSADWRAL